MVDFDDYSTTYDEAVDRGLRLVGESREYFAQARVREVGATLARHASDLQVRRILDYGCGTGETSMLLAEALDAETVIGVDASQLTIREARRRCRGSTVRFVTVEDACSEELFQSRFDVVYTACVFHHIDPAEWLVTAKRLHESLRPGGMLAFFEHNPWNPGTRLVVSRVEFDRDAVLLSRRRATSLLLEAGFQIAVRRSYFYFPRWLSFLRRLELPLGRLPFGGQYALYARRRQQVDHAPGG